MVGECLRKKHLRLSRCSFEASSRDGSRHSLEGGLGLVTSQLRLILAWILCFTRVFAIGIFWIGVDIDKSGEV